LVDRVPAARFGAYQVENGFPHAMLHRTDDRIAVIAQFSAAKSPTHDSYFLLLSGSVPPR
jgi:hypothetical protein